MRGREGGKREKKTYIPQTIERCKKGQARAASNRDHEGGGERGDNGPALDSPGESARAQGGLGFLFERRPGVEAQGRAGGPESPGRSRSFVLQTGCPGSSGRRFGFARSRIVRLPRGGGWRGAAAGEQAKHPREPVPTVI